MAKPRNTLKYDIRILGRRGVLVLGALATLNQVAAIEKQTPQILSMIIFNDGSRHSDFDSKTDQGGHLWHRRARSGRHCAKLGFFKLNWVCLLAATKFVIIAVIAVVAWPKKLYSRSKSRTPM
jgi:uncharacterized membrane-anchored protein